MGATTVTNRPEVVKVTSRPQRTAIALTPRQVSRIEALRSVSVSARPSPVKASVGPRPVQIGGTGRRGLDGVDGAGSVPQIAFAYGDAASVVWTADQSGLLAAVRVSIDIAFDGVGAAIKVGSTIGAEDIVPAAGVDAAQVADFEYNPDIEMVAGDTVCLSITPGSGASQGSGFLLLTFIPD